MLTRLTAGEVPAYFDAFWSVALDLRRSGYPTYTDGIKTREDWENSLLRASQEDWGEVLLYLHEEQPTGLVAVDCVDDEFLSLPVCVCGEHQPDMLAELLTNLRVRYPGRTLWLGFAPENEERLSFARTQGFELLDDLVNWNVRDWSAVPAPEGIRAVTAENYAAFSRLWTNDTIYWNAERIRHDLDRWRLFVTEDAAVACMDVGDMLEVFGFVYRDRADAAVMRRLLTACLNASEGRPLTYFADRAETPVMEAMGFRRVSGYVCYQKTL